MTMYDGHALIQQFTVYVDFLRLLILTWLLFWLIGSKNALDVRKMAIYVSIIMLIMTVVRLTLLIFLLKVPVL